MPPKPKPVGRPKLHKDHAKSNIIPVRFNAGDLKRVQDAALAKDQTVSTWIRKAIDAALA
ncbi:MAG: hypothetical protein ACRYFU_21045 [Janthinobacterium lividum]